MGTRRQLIAVVAIGATAAALFLRGDGDRVRKGTSEPERPGRSAAGDLQPVRIFPGSAAAVDWLVALEIEPNRVVALPEQVERWSSLRHAPGPWEAHPRYARLTSEVALGYEPDLVLASPFSDASTIERIRQGVEQRIRGGGGRVISVDDPGDWATFLGIVETLAGATGESAQGERVLASMEARREALANRGGAALRVLPYGNFGGGGSTSGTGTTVDLAIQLAGFTNVAAEAGMSGSAELGFEQILAMEFDVFVLPGDDVESSSSARALADARVLEGVRAVKERRYLLLSDALFASSSITILDAAESLAKQGDRLEPGAR
ncbi:MAG: ABC transporter substrate-binding protein [Planctomycetota bacterium]